MKTFKLFGYTIRVEKTVDRDKLAAEGIWVQKDGTQIKVADMDNGHLENTIGFIERGATYSSEFRFPRSSYAVRTLGWETMNSQPIVHHLLSEVRARVSRGQMSPITVLGKEIS